MSDMSTYQEVIFMTRYARWKEEEQRREFWEETCDRYINFFVDYLQKNHNYSVSKNERKRVRKAMVAGDVMPSMRAFMTAGKALESAEVAGYNCSFSIVDSVKSMTEHMYILMCGTGSGFSVERRFTQKLPEVPEELHQSDTVIAVPDSRKGWCVAYGQLLNILYSGGIPKWDVSKVRKAGTRLKTFGGYASGPEPLVELFEFTIKTFDNARGRRLKPVEVFDLMCYIAQIVVVGGVRRSATICLFDKDDVEMRTAKSGAWWVNHAHRAMANISAVFESKPDSLEFLDIWRDLVASKSGEPGILNRKAIWEHCEAIGRKTRYDNGERIPYGVNPCCLDGDTLVHTVSGPKKIRDITEPTQVFVDGYLYNCTAAWVSGEKDLYTLETVSGHKIDLTADHRIMTTEGWMLPKDLTEDSTLVLGTQRTLPDDTARVPTTKFKSLTHVGKREVFDLRVDTVERFDANGFIVHNSEILLWPMSFCNLSGVCIRPDDTLETLIEKAEVATILGTWQACLDNFDYLRKAWKANIQEERLLGVCLAGVMDNAMTASDCSESAEWYQTLRAHVWATNQKHAKAIGINPSTSVTALKPAGNSGELYNVSSGIHPRYAPYYVRTVRQSGADPMTEFLKAQGIPWEVSKQNARDVVFSFPVKSPDGAICAKDRSALEQLEHWLHVKNNYTTHTVSCTIYVKDDEWVAVGNWVYNNFDNVTGISFLPYDDHTYEQAPYQPISKEKYEELTALMPETIDWSLLKHFEGGLDTTTVSQDFACTSGACMLN